MLKFVLLFLTALIHISSECNIIDYGVHPPAPYDVALETCAMDAGQLIIPTNADEVEYLTESAAWADYYWIGIHALFTDQEYVTLNGDKFVEDELLQWEFGFPNRLLGGCGELRYYGVGNNNCTYNNKFVCKKVSFGRNAIVKTVDQTFRDAIITCALEGAQLMSPQSLEEFNNLMFIVTAANSPIWLGIHDKFEEGNFINLNGESVFPSEFLQWAPGSPAVNSTNNCVQLRPDRLIYDMPCDNSNRYFCNKLIHDDD